MGADDGEHGAGPPGSGGGVGTGDSCTGRLSKPWLLAAVAGTVVVLDRITKRWVVENLTLHEIVPVWGDFFRLTYTHNFGAAFGIDVGQYSRVFFLTLAVLALGVLMYLYVRTPAKRRLRLWSLALVSGGAVGNVIDRVRYEAGVVDFLDVGVGSLRWPVFNVADMAVSIGAILLMITFYREETASTDPARASPGEASSGQAGQAARAETVRGSGGEAPDDRVRAGEG